MLLLLVARPDGGVAVADVTGTSSRGDVMRLGWQYFRAEAIPQMEGVLDAVVQREARIGCPLRSSNKRLGQQVTHPKQLRPQARTHTHTAQHLSSLLTLVGRLRRQSPVNLCLRMQVWHHACAEEMHAVGGIKLNSHERRLAYCISFGFDVPCNW